MTEKTPAEEALIVAALEWKRTRDAYTTADARFICGLEYREVVIDAEGEHDDAQEELDAAIAAVKQERQP